MLHTTLALLRKQRDNEKNNKFLVEHLGRMEKYSDNTPIPLTVILDNSLDPIRDTLYCLRAVPSEERKEAERIARLFAADCAEHVLQLFEQEYPEDKKPRIAIEVARKFVNGEKTEAELDAIRRTIYDSAVEASVKVLGRFSPAAAAANAAACAVNEDAVLDAPYAAENALKASGLDAEKKWQENRLREYLAGKE